MAKVQAICAYIAEGNSLRKACRDLQDMPSPAGFLLWCNNDAAIAEQYTRARATGADVQFDELDELERMEPRLGPDGKVDSGFVAWRKMQIDTRKWTLARKAPKKYGESLALAADPNRPALNIGIMTFGQPTDPPTSSSESA